MNSRPWTPFVDKDSQPGKHLYKVRFDQSLPEMLPCILFDAVNNLRASLDQVGYAAAVAAKMPSLKATKFPFGPTEEKFRNNVAGGCKDLPPEIRAIFERSNAYKGGNTTLWTLNEIANAKKHLALMPVRVAGVRGAAIYPSNFSGLGEGNVIVPARDWNPTKNEMTMFAAEPGAQMQVQTNLTFAVAIEGIQGVHAPYLLAGMANEVQSILVAAESECRRLGFQLGD